MPRWSARIRSRSASWRLKQAGVSAPRGRHARSRPTFEHEQRAAGRAARANTLDVQAQRSGNLAGLVERHVEARALDLRRRRAACERERVRRGREHQADDKRGPGGDASAHPRRRSSVSSTATTAATNAICPNVDAVPQPAPTAFAISVATAKATTKNAELGEPRLSDDPAQGVRSPRSALYSPKTPLHRPADLAERAVGVHGLDDRGHDVLVTLGGGP